MTKDPLSRLGNGIPDADRIKEHAFFSGIDWSKVAAREAQPPPIPEGSYTFVWLYDSAYITFFPLKKSLPSCEVGNTFKLRLKTHADNYLRLKVCKRKKMRHVEWKTILNEDRENLG